MSKCQALPNSYWLGALSRRRHTGSPKKQVGGGGVVRCKKKHKGKKDVIRTGQYNAHFVCRMPPDAGIPFCRMLPDVSPSLCRMPPDATKNFAGC